MRSLKKLDIPKSIQSKKLIFQEGMFDKLDTLILYFTLLMLIGVSIWGLKETHPSFNSSLEYFFLICLLSFSLYVLYCKFTEKRLKEIKFAISQAEAKNRIIKYAQKRNYRISKPANNLIYLNELADLYSFVDYERTTIIFFKGNSILYTLIQEGSRSNFTVLISQHLIKIDLKKILQQQEINTEAKKKGYFSSLFHG